MNCEPISRRTLLKFLIVIGMASGTFAFDCRAYADESTSAEPASDLVVVIGASGTPEYGKQFSDWASTWRDVAEQAAASFTMIGELNPSGQSNTKASSDHDQLRKALNELTDTSRGNLWLVLIGHGTFARKTAKFNLRGPDVTAAELADWLSEAKRPVVVVNCASASGPFINRISGNNRVIVTATKSGTEQNFARFGEFIAKSIISPDSDLDHDDEVSIQEAFLRASAEVQQFYDEADRISTEHALIDDNGDSRGTPATMFRGTRPTSKSKSDASLDGFQAATMTLAPADRKLPFTQAELDRRRELEAQLVELRSHKTLPLDEATYDGELALIDDNGDSRGTPATMFRGTRPTRASQRATRRWTVFKPPP